MQKNLLRIAYLNASLETASVETMSGVNRYAAAHPNWSVQFRGYHNANSSITDFSSWQPDGIIVPQNVPFDKVVSTLGTFRAAVFLHDPPPADLSCRTAMVKCDNAAIGRLAGQHLKANGLTDFAFIGSFAPRIWSDERRDAFRRAVRAEGCSYREYHPRRTSNWAEELDSIKAFLLRLPRPCGLFAAYDLRARQVLDACRDIGFSVPGEFQLLGVDNDACLCDNNIAPLSSVDADFHAVGYAAAECLDALLRGGASHGSVVKVPPKGVINRLSTCDKTAASRHVALAKNFIRRFAVKPISISEIALASKCSVRVLQMNFRRIVGHGIAEELRRRRLEHACELLEHTRVDIMKIPALCSLGNPAYALTAFRRAFGITMKQWRARNHRLRRVVSE